jgi:hypothetical protein
MLRKDGCSITGEGAIVRDVVRGTREILRETKKGRQSKKQAGKKFMSTTETQRQVFEALVPPKNRVYRLSRASN